MLRKWRTFALALPALFRKHPVNLSRGMDHTIAPLARRKSSTTSQTPPPLWLIFLVHPQHTVRHRGQMEASTSNLPTDVRADGRQFNPVPSQLQMLLAVTIRASTRLLSYL
ncbi:hypothetical protein C8Q79DRAFT_731719 [Trametes meyenii]|nr:hypothetical protein C8Q79DRAFT_731719 [Trametes meyenii]